jgi:hypothetical protein
VHRVHRDPHELRPDHLVTGERGVKFGRVEASQPVPQGDVCRRRLLRLQCHHASCRVGDAQRFTIQQELAGQRGPVELLR